LISSVPSSPYLQYGSGRYSLNARFGSQMQIPCTARHYVVNCTIKTPCSQPEQQRTLKCRMPIIELKDVSKLYGFGDATTLALDEVNLSINEGEFVAVMGPSGCGKSTLMNLIGLLDRPTHGV